MDTSNIYIYFFKIFKKEHKPNHPNWKGKKKKKRRRRRRRRSSKKDKNQRRKPKKKKKERKRPKKKMTIHVHFAYWFFHPHRWEAFFYLVFSSIWRENILVDLKRKHPHSTNSLSFLLSNQTPTKMIFSPSFFIPLKSL